MERRSTAVFDHIPYPAPGDRQARGFDCSHNGKKARLPTGCKRAFCKEYLANDARAALGTSENVTVVGGNDPATAAPTTQPADCNLPAIRPNIGRMDCANLDHLITNTAVKGADICALESACWSLPLSRNVITSNGSMPETDGRNLPEHRVAKAGDEFATTRRKGKSAERTFFAAYGIFHTWEMFRRLSVKPDMPSFARETSRPDCGQSEGRTPIVAPLDPLRQIARLPRWRPATVPGIQYGIRGRTWGYGLEAKVRNQFVFPR